MEASYSRDRRGRDSWLGLSGRGIGLLAGVSGLGGAAYLLMTSVVPYVFSPTGTLSSENAPVFLVWSIALVALSIGAGYSAWHEMIWVVWGLAGVTSAITVFALFSFGGVVAPMAGLLLVAAILLSIERMFQST
ncbi:hypothetical protein [Halococcus sp. IIIV-5B]|uniref:hypothetical protein n=1 Tax=Halococcus sp. IIIV-5B TaxID=2321230 RepID=UPI000E773082|nr:hypothetical protein [Halococcus sp. IIIV-5B]RJT07557.1 hypothetical protein D3261_02885 [Halococcus sp. IIIV-5B]